MLRLLPHQNTKGPEHSGDSNHRQAMYSCNTVRNITTDNILHIIVLRQLQTSSINEGGGYYVEYVRLKSCVDIRSL
jgi:hypothetical protein